MLEYLAKPLTFNANINNYNKGEPVTKKCTFLAIIFNDSQEFFCPQSVTRIGLFDTNLTAKTSMYSSKLSTEINCLLRS